MDNIINPAGQVRPVSHRGSRWARLWVAVVAAGVAAGAVRAQTSYSISTLAGQPNSPGAVDAVGAAARFRDPASVVADSAGNLYVADTTNHAVRKVVISTGAVTTVAGLLGTSGTADGAGTVARFNLPQGLALDAGANKLYVADTFNHTIRVIDLAPATPVVSTLAGGAGSTGSTNATGTAARFNSLRPGAVRREPLRRRLEQPVDPQDRDRHGRRHHPCRPGWFREQRARNPGFR